MSFGQSHGVCSRGTNARYQQPDRTDLRNELQHELDLGRVKALYDKRKLEASEQFRLESETANERKKRSGSPTPLQRSKFAVLDL